MSSKEPNPKYEAVARVKPGSLPPIPGYVVEREIGRGSSGVVYQARQISVDRPVALKVMHPGLGNNTRSIRRLQREARISAHLAHPNLISAIDMGESAGQWWFAMELVEGPSLAERLERGGRLMESEALHLFEKLCDALQHASEKGVVHRDIKPANILLERPDFPRLVDLGLARNDDDPMLTRTGATLGTPHYISPEQARDPALADVRSDIWSLGATLYHAVCGRPPFAGESTAEILSSVLYGPIPDPCELRPELSKGLGLVLRKCLSRDPELRYFAPLELREDLQLVRAHKAPQIRAGALEPLDPTSGNRPRVGVGLALGSMLVLALVLLVWKPWSPTTQDGVSGRQEQQSGPWLPLQRFEERLEAGDTTLAAAFADIVELGPRVPERARNRYEAVQTSLKRSLQDELGAFWKSQRNRIDGLLESYEFDAVQEKIDRGLVNDLLARTGFTPENLPRELERASFLRRAANERRRLEEARSATQLTASTTVQRYVQRVLLPAVARERRLGSWNEAREMLAGGIPALLPAAKVQLRGVNMEALLLTLEPLALELAKRHKDLETAWEALDSGLLLDGVNNLVTRARRALEAGDREQSLDRYEQGFASLLERHGMDRDSLSLAPSHRSLDRFLMQRLELEDQADEIAQRLGTERLAELEELCGDFYVRRDYEAAVAFWQAHQDEPLLAVVEDDAAVRLEGAQELLAFLRRAALGIQRRGGARVSLTQGTIKVSGKVLLSGDPWERGFRLMMSQSTARDYLLRANDELEGEILDPRVVETFAIAGADLTSDIGLQLQRALFRYWEDDFIGAHELLSSAALSGGDLITYDLGLRVARELGREQDVLDRREVYADRELDRLSGADADAMNPKLRAIEIGRLLRSYRDVLGAANEALLLSIRAGLLQELPPSTLQDFESVFSPREVSFPRFGRARMVFLFDDAEIGSWDRGEWFFTGDRAWVGLPVANLRELELRPSPRLKLVDPLSTDEAPVEVRIRFFQPKDSPPELFAVSLLGFHAVFIGETLRDPARVLTGTSNLEDVARRARGGEGKDCLGFVIENEHLVVIRISRGSGKITVRVDGNELDSRLYPPPAPSASSRSLILRSIEPLEVREVVIESDRR